MVISTTSAAGRDVTIRRILGLWPGVRVRVSRLIRSRTRSVVQGASCLGDRAPARISAITWANCLDQAATGSGAPSAGRPALNVSEGPRSEEHTSELQSRRDLVCRLLLEKK